MTFEEELDALIARWVPLSTSDEDMISTLELAIYRLKEEQADD